MSLTEIAAPTARAVTSNGIVGKNWRQYLPSPTTMVAIGALALSSRYTLPYAACSSVAHLARDFLAWKNKAVFSDETNQKVRKFHQDVSKVFTEAVDKSIWMGINTVKEHTVKYALLFSPQMELAQIKNIDAHPEYSIAYKKLMILHKVSNYYATLSPNTPVDSDLTQLCSDTENLYNDISAASHGSQGQGFQERYERVLKAFRSFEESKLKTAPRIRKELANYLQIIHFYLVNPTKISLSPLTVVFAIRKFQFELGNALTVKRESDPVYIARRAKYVELHQTLMRASSDIASCPDFLVGLNLLNKIHSAHFLRVNSQNGERLPTVAEFPIEKSKTLSSIAHTVVTWGFWIGIGYEALRHIPSLCSRIFTRQ